ncbi:MAG: Shedu immune nuclease family protein [Allosphingosinicella sp.]
MADNDFQLLQVDSSLGIAFDLQMSRAISREANRELKASDPLPTRLLFEIHLGEDELITYPTYTRPTDRFLKAKYLPIRSISFELSSSYEVPESQEQAIEFLDQQLPSMFIRDPGYGLGVTNLISPLINVISTVPHIQYLLISISKSTQVNRNKFILNYDDYEELRLTFGRIARKYQAESRIERTIFANDALLNPLDPERYPLKGRGYVTGTIHKLLGGPQLKGTVLKGKDRIGVAQAVSANARNLAEKNPDEFVRLQRKIELVSLDVLIDRFRKLEAGNAAEQRWQTLFELNPFILSMIFGYPVVLVAGGSSVGGGKFWGNGEKIADFLLKNEKTHNAALVEIKRPDTELIGAKYREEVWRPHPDLTGAIVQVLDQRSKFVKSLPSLKDNSDYYEIQAHSVDCVIVAGCTPVEKDKRASFELFRTQIKDVRIVTFDELLAKLELLRDLLAGESVDLGGESHVDDAKGDEGLDGDESDDISAVYDPDLDDVDDNQMFDL